MISRWRRDRREQPAELQITAFMNLMVILVPFLLITAVFSQMAVLDLNLPDPDAQVPEDEPPPLALTVIVRDDELLVMDSSGPIQRFDKTASGHAYRKLGTLLEKIKRRLPQEDKIAVLLEPDIEYDVLVKTMDAVRVMPDGKTQMFPKISIGDAPPQPSEAAS